MSGISDSNATDSFDQSLVVIKGGTDNTSIGNIGDRLKIDSLVNFPTGQVISWNKYIRWFDMNASYGGVARDTSIPITFTNLFSYSGSGYFIGFNLTLEDKLKWFFSLVIDGENIFDTNGISTDDLGGKNLYGWEPTDISDSQNTGFFFRDETIRFESPLHAIRFESSIVIKARHIVGSKKFRAGLVCLQRNI
jgi:hypothetical protein